MKKSKEPKTIKEAISFSKAVKMMDPLYDRSFEAVFPIHNVLLSEQISSISIVSKQAFGLNIGTIRFSLNIDANKRLIPFREIVELTNHKECDFRINMFRHDGEITLTTVFHKCKFTFSIDSIMQHDYSSGGIKEAEVSFTWNSLNMLDENSEQLI